MDSSYSAGDAWSVLPHGAACRLSEPSTKDATRASENVKTARTVFSDDKAADEFRTYDVSKSERRVVEHFRDMRTHQTVEFYRRMEAKYFFEDGKYCRLMTMEEAFQELENYVGASDPDLSLPNKLHMLQTAEGIRRDGHPDWFQLVGLLHDIGKIMFLWGVPEDGQDGRGLWSDAAGSRTKQWALGGDTFVVGCRIPDDDGGGGVFPEFNALNPDIRDDRYSTPCGMYERHCGLDKLCFAWGHDDYMYRMLVANDCRIPQEGLDMIRYHSAYPLHSSSAGGKSSAYSHLLKVPGDLERIEWVRLLNRYDLYTKDDDNDIRCDWDRTLWPYYHGLLDKYGLGGRLKW